MSPQPYGSAARAYLAAGYWPLPLPPRKKASPPEGYTGRNGRRVDPADVDRWIAGNRSGNIGLRLPAGVAGIDVDAYKDDLHMAAWEELTARCGPLPDAPWCSSRNDGISGIRLFRVPEDWEAAGKLPEGGNGVSPGEVIQWHHRYVVCPPSIHPGTGRAYRWRSGSITKVADLPALPQPWLDALSSVAVPAQPAARPAPRTTDLATRPGDDFNERADWLADILGPHGWELHHETGDTLYVTRPGKSAREGRSATIGHSKDGVDRLYVFSAEAAPFEMETPYTKFAAYALLNHGGDYQAAARELGRIGYGSKQPAPVTPPTTPASDDEVSRQDGRAEGRVTVIHAYDRGAPWPDGPAGTTKEERTKPPGPAVPAPDRRMYAGLLGEVVWAADPTTEADPVGVYASLQAAVGVAIGQGSYIQVGNTRHPLLIWPLLFGRTGSGRKGDATETAGVFFRRAEPDSDKYTVGGLSSGEGLIERLRDARDENDDGGTSDKRLLIVEPEFGSVMARSKREGSTLAAVQRQAWDGKALSVLNRQALKASASHVAIIGHITPQEFRIRLAESDMAGGTYNRYLPLYVDRSKPRSTGQIVVFSGVLTRKVPSDLGEWELSKLPVPGSRGHPVSAIVA